MKSSAFLTAAAAAATLLLTAGTQAAQLYSFETISATGATPPTGPNGFFNAAGAVVGQSTTGATSGTFALSVLKQANGYSQAAVRNTTPPAALLSSTSYSFDLTINGSALPYAYVQASFFISASPSAVNPFGLDTRLDPAGFLTGEGDAVNPAANQNLGGQNLTGATQTQSLVAYRDPLSASNGFTGLYTPAQIVAHNVAANPDIALGAFQFTITNGGATPAAPAGVTYYIDNVSVPNVPEPASLGLIAVGGAMLARRRSR